VVRAGAALVAALLLRDPRRAPTTRASTPVFDGLRGALRESQAHLVDPAGIEPALTRIKNPPLNRSATGLCLVNPGGLEPPAVGLKVPCPANPGFVRSGSEGPRV
jgi:hypothetical protein